MGKTTESTNDIIDIDLSVIRKKRIRINGDDSMILELNLSDMNIAKRLNEVLPKLNDLESDYAKIQSEEDESTDEFMEKFASSLETIDGKMRELIDYLFNSNVSEICASDGSMYDLFNGDFRCDYIISTLMKLYEDNVQSEFEIISKKLEKKTAKYTKGK